MRGFVATQVPSSVRSLMGEMKQAMELLHLEKRTLFYSRRHETKILIAWNRRLILVSARGSFAATNFIADAKVRQTVFGL